MARSIDASTRRWVDAEQEFKRADAELSDYRRDHPETDSYDTEVDEVIL